TFNYSPSESDRSIGIAVSCSFLPMCEIQQLGKIWRPSAVPGAGCYNPKQQPQVFVPVPATAESSAAFPSSLNVHRPSFLLTIA
nr:hypothetical protein [Nostoc sp. ChiSLP01]MDZ8286909.1 hypothetical protein [Nostoc sp. ChiSLP01]